MVIGLKKENFMPNRVYLVVRFLATVFITYITLTETKLNVSTMFQACLIVSVVHTGPLRF